MSDTIHTDTLHVIHTRAAGLDVHKMQITATVRLRATLRTRIHQVLDGAGLRIGGLLSDLFGVNGRRILEGLAAGRAPDDILAGLSGHVQPRLAALGDALSAPPARAPTPASSCTVAPSRSQVSAGPPDRPERTTAPRQLPARSHPVKTDPLRAP